jgi:hypothetical protein
VNPQTSAAIDLFVDSSLDDSALVDAFDSEEVGRDQEVVLSKASETPGRNDRTDVRAADAVTPLEARSLRRLNAGDQESTVDQDFRARQEDRNQAARVFLAETSSLLSEMVWLPIEFDEGVFVNSDESSASQPMIAATNPFAILQLFVGGDAMDAEPTSAFRFPLLAGSDDPPLEEIPVWSLDRSRWTFSAISLLLVSTYWYQRQIRQQDRETNDLSFVPYQG